MTEADEPAVAPEPGEAAGAGIVNATFAGTGAIIVLSAAGALAPTQLGTLVAGASTVFFIGGVVAFLYGYAVGVVRSREDKVTLAGLFFLVGTAPKTVRFRMRIAFAIQVVAAVAAAAMRPYTSVAFIVLAPLFGLGMLSVWGARHGQFFAKEPQ